MEVRSGRGVRSGGQGGCEQGIEVIVKMPNKSRGGGGVGPVGGSGRGGPSGWMCAKN